MSNSAKNVHFQCTKGQTFWFLIDLEKINASSHAFICVCLQVCENPVVCSHTCGDTKKEDLMQLKVVFS